MDDNPALDKLKEFIFIFVRMPNHFTFELCQFYILTIQFAYYSWRPIGGGGGKYTMLSLGDASKVSLAEARDRVKGIRKDLRAGISPRRRAEIDHQEMARTAGSRKELIR